MARGDSPGKYGVLGALIRDRRRELDLSQRQIVAALQRVRPMFDRSEWRRWEKGDVAPSRFWMPHVAAVLDVRVKELWKAKAMLRQFPADGSGEDG
jgi:transcriptional regulator with XRE-family HTH domain